MKKSQRTRQRLLSLALFFRAIQRLQTRFAAAHHVCASLVSYECFVFYLNRQSATNYWKVEKLNVHHA